MKEDCPINTTVFIDGNSVPSYLKRMEKPIPRYRRASTGSCHDNCKFGVQHSSESKKYWSVRRRCQDHANTGNGKQDRAEIINRTAKPRNKDQKLKISHGKDGSAPAKPEFTKPKPPPKGVPDHSEFSPCVKEFSNEASEPIVAVNQPADSKCHIMAHDDLYNCGDGELSEGAVSIELEMPLAIQDIDESDDHIVDIILPSEDVREAGEQSHVDHVSDNSLNDCVSSAKRTNQAAMAAHKHGQDKHGTKSESFSKESVKPKVKATLTITRNAMSNDKRGITSRRKSAATEVESSNAPKTTGKKAGVSATSEFNREKGFNSIVASAFPEVKELKVPLPSSAMDSSAKPATFYKLKAWTAKNAPSPSLPSGKQSDRKMTVKNVVKNAPLWQKNGEEKVRLSPLKLSCSISMSAKSLLGIKMRAVKKEDYASPLKRNKKVYGTESSSTDCKEKILKTASPKIRKPEVNNRESRSRKEKAATSRTETARGPKSASISSSTAPPSPRKLTFRQGKVLNLHSISESNTPRRLRFRPAKATDDSSRSKEPTKGRINRNTDPAASDATKDSGALQVEVVVLRRQVVNDRKSGQGLLNNMIEETASKLVEARKSKVKALVRAFKTVISLQESKTATSS